MLITSPDLTPLDFFLWGHMKTLVYETPVESEMDLIARIAVASECCLVCSSLFRGGVRSALKQEADTLNTSVYTIFVSFSTNHLLET